MDLHEILTAFEVARQPVTALLDGQPAGHLDPDALLEAGQTRLAQLRPDLLEGSRGAIVQACHGVDVAITSPNLAPATVVIRAATVTHVWLLSEPIEWGMAGALCRLMEGRLGGAAWRSAPTSPMLVPGAVDFRGAGPVPVAADGTGEMVSADALLTDPVGRDAVRSILNGVLAA